MLIMANIESVPYDFSHALRDSIGQLQTCSHRTLLPMHLGYQLLFKLSLSPPVAHEDGDVEADVDGGGDHLVGEREDRVVLAQEILQRVSAELEVVVLLQNYAESEC